MKEPLKKLAELGSACVRIGARKPSDLRHVFGMMHFAATQIQDPEADIRSFATMEWQEIFPEPFVFQFYSFPGVGASISLSERVALANLKKMVWA